MSWELKIEDKSRLLLSLPDKEAIKALLGSALIVFGEVKVELTTIETCSSSFKSSSAYNLNNDISSTFLEVASSTTYFVISCSATTGYEVTLTNLTLEQFLLWKLTWPVSLTILGPLVNPSTWGFETQSVE